jgi:HEAT repeats
MRAVKTIAAVFILASLPLSADAHGGFGIGINLGVPFYGGYGYGGYGPYGYRPYPYYYYRPYAVYVPPPAVIVRPAVVLQSAPVLQPAYSSPVESAPPPLAVQQTDARQDGAEQQLQLLNSPEDRVRADAAVQLGRLKAARAVQPLTQMLNGDRSALVREAAARALGLIDAPAALPALQRAAQADDDRDVRHSAQFAAEGIRSNMPR